MNRTLEEGTIRTQRPVPNAGVAVTISDQQTQMSVPAILSSLQPRPAAWVPKVLSQLCRLPKLPANWDSYNAEPVADEVTHSAAALLLDLGAMFDLPVPMVSPTRRGGVLLEWESGPRALEIELVSRDAAAFLFTDDDRGFEREGELFRDDPELGTLREFLEQMCWG
jgi:hypothetical protein